MIGLKEAENLALEYAEKLGYSTISLLKNSYEHKDFGECFVFSPAISKNTEGDEIEYVGLPEMVFVDKVTSFVFTDRVLI